LTWPEASKAASEKGSTLVWPFGACEQHGPHLPLITDTFFAENILNALKENEKVNKKRKQKKSSQESVKDW